MARPFRFHPPEHSRELVVRERVQQSLSGRFDRQATVIVGGAGFGKTSALVQAFEESRLRPMGMDHWLACERADADVEHLLAALAAVFDREDIARADDVDAGLQAIVEELSSRAPSRQCLVLDDVHHLPAGSSGADLLDRLLDRLPANASMTLASRSRPPLALWRLELTGECVVIDETDLAFDDDDIEKLAELTGLPSRRLTSTTLAGWPALVRLSLSHVEPQAFIIEEVLEVLDSEQLALLRMLLVVGDVDAEVLAMAAGVTTARPLESVPLVHRRDGRFGAHDLWATILADDGADIERRRRAIDALLDQHENARAVDVALQAERPQEMAAELSEALRASLLVTAVPDGGDLRRWRSAVPEALAGTAAVTLLDGLIARIDNPGSEVCHAQLRRAADMFESAGDTRAAVAALSALTFALHVRRDVGGLMHTFGRLDALAEAGERFARPYQLLARAVVATAEFDPRAVVGHTDELLNQVLPDDTRAIALWMRASALSNLGEDAVEPAAECIRFDLPLPGISFIDLSARWRAGRMEELIETTDDLPRGGRDRFLAITWKILFTSSVGDVAGAAHWLELLDDSASDVSQWQTAGSVLIPRAVALIALDDFDGAMGALREMIERHPLEGQAIGYYLHAIALFYPFFPEMRSWYDLQEDLGPLYQRDLLLNQAYVAVVEQRDLSVARTVRFPELAGEFMPALGLRHAAVLLAAALDAGNPAAEGAIIDLIGLVGENARTEFRRALEHDLDVVVAGARKVIESMPVRPAGSVSIAVLGGSDLWLDDERVESADWRRERVRALLTFLVLHRTTTREQATAALWPDAESSAGKRSLRSTLNVLNQVLEPDRIGGDAPFFIRSFGQRLQLVSDTQLLVDVDCFEAFADEAERLEAAGTPSLSIEPYRQAARSYGGDLLPDSYDDWVVFARDRLRARFVRVSVRCAELLTATGHPDEAIDVIAPVLDVESWAEAAHRALISAHLERDDLASARRALATCRQVLDEVGGIAEPATFELERRLSRL